jgi:hypothetical protein
LQLIHVAPAPTNILKIIYSLMQSPENDLKFN